MDFIVDFLKAVFIERDKGKIKDSIVTIAVVIIALWVVNSYTKIGDGIEENSQKIDKISNYKVIVVSVSDSIFTIKSIEIKNNTDEKIEEVINLIHSLDNKRRKEMDYIAKYKDKSYQELMDILQLNEDRWEYNINRNTVMELSSITMEDETLRTISPIVAPIEKTSFIVSQPVATTDILLPIVEDVDTLSVEEKKDNFFIRLFRSKKRDD